MTQRATFQTRQRRGIALLAVLSAIIAIAALGAATRAQLALDDLRLERDRLRIRARWAAEGCVNAGLAEIESALRTLAPTDERRTSIDSIVLPRLLTQGAGCTVDLRPLGVGLTGRDRAVEARLANYLTLTLGESAHTDSLVAALLDWEDADTVVRPLGAESTWYRSRGRLGPANRPIATHRELSLVRGFEANELQLGVADLIGDEGTAICAKRASLPVLAARLGTSIAVAAQIKRAADAGTAFERRTARSLSAIDPSTGSISRATTPVFACDTWRLEVARAIGAGSDSLSYAATLAMLGSRAAVLSVDVDR